MVKSKEKTNSALLTNLREINFWWQVPSRASCGFREISHKQSSQLRAERWSAGLAIGQQTLKPFVGLLFGSDQ